MSDAARGLPADDRVEVDLPLDLPIQVKTTSLAYQEIDGRPLREIIPALGMAMRSLRLRPGRHTWKVADGERIFHVLPGSYDWGLFREAATRPSGTAVCSECSTEHPSEEFASVLFGAATEGQAWEYVAGVDIASGYEAYLSAFPAGAHAVEASESYALAQARASNSILTTEFEASFATGLYGPVEEFLMAHEATTGMRRRVDERFEVRELAGAAGALFGVEAEGAAVSLRLNGEVEMVPVVFGRVEKGQTLDRSAVLSVKEALASALPTLGLELRSTDPSHSFAIEGLPSSTVELLGRAGVPEHDLAASRLRLVSRASGDFRVAGLIDDDEPEIQCAPIVDMSSEHPHLWLLFARQDSGEGSLEGLRAAHPRFLNDWYSFRIRGIQGPRARVAFDRGSWLEELSQWSAESPSGDPIHVADKTSYVNDKFVGANTVRTVGGLPKFVEVAGIGAPGVFERYSLTVVDVGPVALDGVLRPPTSSWISTRSRLEIRGGGIRFEDGVPTLESGTAVAEWRAGQ